MALEVKNDSTKKVRLYFLVALLFLFFVLLNTCPLIIHISTYQLGDGGDGPEFIWDLWWLKKSVMELHQNPYDTNYIFYPNGTKLYLHTLSPLNGLVSLPLQYLSNNLILSYNLIIILNLVLAGLSMFILAFYLTKSKFASVIAGYIFTFNPYVMGHSLGHLNLVSIWPIPLFILFFIRFHEDPSIKNMIFSSLFIILSTLYCIQIGIFALVFSLIYESFYLITKRFKVTRGFVLKLILVFVLYFLVLSPIFLGMFTSMLSKEYTVKLDSVFWSPDVLTFFVPGNILDSRVFFNNFTWWNREHGISHQGAENQNFLGYTLIILSAVILTTTFKKKKFLFNKLRFWTLLGIIGFVLALGGQLKFFGQVYNFKLPYYYIYKIVPLFWASGRFVLLTFISLSILCTIGLSALLENLSDRKRYLIYMCVLILIILEFLSIPYPLKSYKVSDFYYELGKEKGDFAVYDLSHRYNSDYIAASGLHMYYQTIHNKKIIDGRISRNPLSSLKYAMQGPPLLELEKLNIKYVILPKESNLSESFSNYSLVFKDQEIKVYQIFK